VGSPLPSGPTSHRCPGCGARHAERRTPRTWLERLGVALVEVRTYRCLECGRRFHQRRAAHAVEPGPAPEASPAPRGRAPLKQRHIRWVVDSGDTPLGPTQVYVLVVAAAVVVVLLVLVLRALWPESVGGVRGVD
jgi:hypothetical protein